MGEWERLKVGKNNAQRYCLNVANKDGNVQVQKKSDRPCLHAANSSERMNPTNGEGKMGVRPKALCGRQNFAVAAFRR